MRILKKHVWLLLAVLCVLSISGIIYLVVNTKYDYISLEDTVIGKEVVFGRPMAYVYDSDSCEDTTRRLYPLEVTSWMSISSFKDNRKKITYVPSSERFLVEKAYRKIPKGLNALFHYDIDLAIIRNIESGDESCVLLYYVKDPNGTKISLKPYEIYLLKKIEEQKQLEIMVELWLIDDKFNQISLPDDSASRESLVSDINNKFLKSLPDDYSWSNIMPVKYHAHIKMNVDADALAYLISESTPLKIRTISEIEEVARER